MAPVRPPLPAVHDGMGGAGYRYGLPAVRIAPNSHGVIMRTCYGIAAAATRFARPEEKQQPYTRRAANGGSGFFLRGEGRNRDAIYYFKGPSAIR